MLNMPKLLTNSLSLIKENIIVFTIVLYSLAYIFNVSYYALFFHIPVFYYISLNDLTFWSIEYLTKFIFVGIGFILSVYALSFVFVSTIIVLRLLLVKRTFFKLALHNFKSRQAQNSFLRVFAFFNKATKYKSFGGFHAIFAAIVLLLSFLSSLQFQVKYFLLLDTMLYLTISDDFSLKQLKTVKSLKVYLVIAVGVFVGSQFTGYFNAVKVQEGRDQTAISFISNGVRYCASGKKFRYTFIGETSSYIFLYDRENKNSRVFFKENISDLIIGEAKESKKLEGEQPAKVTTPVRNDSLKKDSINILSQKRIAK